MLTTNNNKKKPKYTNDKTADKVIKPKPKYKIHYI